MLSIQVGGILRVREVLVFILFLRVCYFKYRENTIKANISYYYSFCKHYLALFALNKTTTIKAFISSRGSHFVFNHVTNT